MYVPKHFAATDDQLAALLAAPIAGDLITPTVIGVINGLDRRGDRSLAQAVRSVRTKE